MGKRHCKGNSKSHAEYSVLDVCVVGYPLLFSANHRLAPALSCILVHERPAIDTRYLPTHSIEEMYIGVSRSFRASLSIVGNYCKSDSTPIAPPNPPSHAHEHISTDHFTRSTMHTIATNHPTPQKDPCWHTDYSTLRLVILLVKPGID
jgi:hypothetical protein